MEEFVMVFGRLGVGGIVNTVSEPAPHISHEAILRWDVRMRRLGRTRYRQRCPALPHIIFGPDDAYLRDQFSRSTTRSRLPRSCCESSLRPIVTRCRACRKDRRR